MKPWRYHPKALENRLSLVRFVKSEVDFSELRAVAHAVFTALWPPVQPLSVDLTLAARSPREFPYINRKFLFLLEIGICSQWIPLLMLLFLHRAEAGVGPKSEFEVIARRRSLN